MRTGRGGGVEMTRNSLIHDFDAGRVSDLDNRHSV